MAVMTIRLPDSRHDRLKRLAAHRGISLNKRIEELSVRCLAEHATEWRFRARAARGDRGEGLRILDELDAAFDERSPGAAGR